MDTSTFAMNTLVFLGAAIVMVPLVKRLGLSAVIGYILGGIIIGPFVLKLTGNEAEGVMEATEFGVVMLLFLIGLELDPKKFWAMRRKILGLGLSQVLLTVFILFGFFLLADWPIERSFAIAMCFSLSSTAIVLQTLREKNMFSTSAGVASFSTLLFQDIAVIPILALLPMIAKKNVESDHDSQFLIQMLPEWLQSFSVLIGVAVLILLGKYVFIPFLRYVSRSGMSELLTGSSLFLILAVSELMIMVGLSPALGAFLAGVMLANSEFRNELESNVEPFKGLLLAVFFVSIGSMMNFKVIADNYIFISSLVIVILVVKFVVLLMIGKLFKLDILQNFFYAFALSQVGEFAFVLLSFSSKIAIIDRLMLSQLMAVTAITMCITPILLLIYDKLISQKIHPKQRSDVRYSVLDEDVKQKKIIIVGFGHFGSTVGRLLKANKISATVLDSDIDRVELLRSYGFKVYYGDASRLPVLHAAGIEDADILILCLDNPENNKFIAEMIREKYPKIKIFVRAKNRNDAYYYINHGIDNIYRETLGTAVDMAVDVLHESGMRKYAAQRMGKRFELIDKRSVRKLARLQAEGDTTSFTFKESIQREQELLALDSMNYASHDLVETHEDEDITDE